MLGELLAITWVAFCILNLTLNGRWWLWEFTSIIPSWAYLPIWFGICTLLILSGSWVLLVITLGSILLIYSEIDVDFVSKRANSNFLPQVGIKLLNWNTQYWCYQKDVEQFYQFLVNHPADIYHLHEAMTYDHEIVDDSVALSKHLAGYKYIQNYEMVTLTRLPVVETRNIGKYSLRVDVMVDKQVVSFYNAHIPVHMSPRELREDPWGFIGTVKRRFAGRKRELGLLLDDLVENPNPVVVSGDFNTPLNLALIHKIRSKLIDAYNSLRAGIPVTYRLGKFKLWRIDYVMGAKVQFLDYQQIDPGQLSDHDAILATISV